MDTGTLRYPVIKAVRGPGTVTAKALLASRNLPAGPVRLPLTAADAALTAELLAAAS